MKTTRFLFLFTLLIVGVTTTACDALDTPSPKTTTQTDTATADQAAGAISSVPPTYFTPAQQEGPYYPVYKPVDRDNDLVDFDGATSAPAGEVLVLNGIVYDGGGNPVEGAIIEIWQTDSSGVYLHPNDPKADQHDRNFQFYGETVTATDGVYSFRTILPGLYEPRPRHIHVKIRLDGDELLTTQFYFPGEASFSGDEVHLVIDLAPAEDDYGNPIWVGQRDIVLNINR